MVDIIWLPVNPYGFIAYSVLLAVIGLVIGWRCGYSSAMSKRP